jgi:hypothetical protein
LGGGYKQNPGGSRRGNADSYLNVIASVAKQSSFLPFLREENWIASSQELLAMTVVGCLKFESGIA